MPYLTDADDIKAAIARYSGAKRLWVDTEIADYLSETPRLSLIQVLDDERDRTGDSVLVFDVLDRPALSEFFIEQIMLNRDIEKVFHNAAYDLRFLGECPGANVTCTWEMAKRLPIYLLPFRNLKLKTLAAELCHFPSGEKSEQQSDWGQRPLSDSQMHYAHMDPVYLAHVHLKLLELGKQTEWEPATEDIQAISQRYYDLKHQLKVINSEVSHLENRLKAAMQAQNVSETEYWKLFPYERLYVKVPLLELASIVQKREIAFDIPINLTKQMRNVLGTFASELPLIKEKVTSWRLNPRKYKDEEQETE